MRILSSDKTAIENSYEWKEVARSKSTVLLKTDLIMIEGSVFIVAPFSGDTAYIDPPLAKYFSDHNTAVECFITSITI